MTHFTWSIEKANRCPACGGATVLITAPECWLVDEEDRTEENEEGVSVSDEISGHYCMACSALASLSLNTID